MATAAIAGYKGAVFVAPTTGSVSRVAEIRDFSLNMEMTEIDVTSHDSSGIRETIPGVKSWTASANYLHAGDNASQKQLFNALVNETTMQIEFYPTGTSSGFPTYSGNAYVTAWGVGSPNDEAHVVDVEFAGTGVVTMSTSS